MFDDASLDRALDAAVFMIYSLNGERCTSSSRLLVQRSIYDEFVGRVAERVKKLKVGHPLDPTTEIGPLIHQRHLDKVLSYFNIARDDGAEIRVGGARAEAVQGGYFVQPTLFANATNTMRVAREEIFGPVLTAIPFADEAEAIAIANDTPYGLAAYIWTQRHRPRLAHGASGGGRHGVGELGEQPPPAYAVRWREVERHRPRRRRLQLRLLHGDEEHLHGARHASRAEARCVRRISVTAKSDSLKGSIPPLITPFRNGEVDYEAYAQLVAFQIKNGSHGILVNGTTCRAFHARRSRSAIGSSTSPCRSRRSACRWSRPRARSRCAKRKQAHRARGEGRRGLAAHRHAVLHPAAAARAGRVLPGAGVDLESAVDGLSHPRPHGRERHHRHAQGAAARSRPRFVGMKHAVNDLGFVSECFARSARTSRSSSVSKS